MLVLVLVLGLVLVLVLGLVLGLGGYQTVRVRWLSGRYHYPNGCAQNDRMPMGWYISLHTIGIRSHLLAYGRFDFSMYVGDTPPQIILYTSKCTQIFMHSPSLHHYSMHCSYILGTLLYFIAKYLYSIISYCSFFDNGEHITINSLQHGSPRS